MAELVLQEDALDREYQLHAGEASKEPRHVTGGGSPLSVPPGFEEQAYRAAMLPEQHLAVTGSDHSGPQHAVGQGAAQHAAPQATYQQHRGAKEQWQPSQAAPVASGEGQSAGKPHQPPSLTSEQRKELHARISATAAVTNLQGE